MAVPSEYDGTWAITLPQAKMAHALLLPRVVMAHVPMFSKEYYSSDTITVSADISTPVRGYQNQSILQMAPDIIYTKYLVLFSLSIPLSWSLVTWLYLQDRLLPLLTLSPLNSMQVFPSSSRPYTHGPAPPTCQAVKFTGVILTHAASNHNSAILARHFYLGEMSEQQKLENYKIFLCRRLQTQRWKNAAPFM